MPPLRMPAEAVSKEIAVAEMVKMANSAAVTLLKFHVMALSSGVRGESPNAYGSPGRGVRFKQDLRAETAGYAGRANPANSVTTRW
jgi:hypothetical protein